MALLFIGPKFPKTKVIKCDDEFPGGVNVSRDEFDGTERGLPLKEVNANNVCLPRAADGDQRRCKQCSGCVWAICEFVCFPKIPQGEHEPRPD